MTEAWRIDSMDAEAGFAFASYRPADLTGEAMPADCEAIYISAPYFSPEVVVSRAPGLAAARGSAQLGLFLGESEVGFNTLDALREFVRRSYVAGSGSGPNGEGSPPLEPPPGGGGPSGGEEAPPRDPEFGIRKLIEAGAWAAGRVEGLAMTEDNVAGSSAFVAPGIVPSDAKQAGAALAAGGLTLAHALISRASVTADRARRNDWNRSVGSLTATLTQMGLHNEFWHGPGLQGLHAAAMKLRGDPSIDLESANYLDLLLEGHAYYLDYWWPRRSHDPLDDLADWPVNQRVATVAGLDWRTATALGVLGALSASPQKLATTPDQAAASEAAGVFLFAAAHIVSWSGDHQRGAARWLSDGSHILFEQAAAWIARQWPQVLFPGQLEGLIDAAAKRPAAQSPMVGA